MLFFAAVLRLVVNYCFHSSNFLRGRVHVGIRWWNFTGANPSKLTSLLIFCLYPGNTFLLIYTNFLCIYFNAIVGSA